MRKLILVAAVLCMSQGVMAQGFDGIYGNRQFTNDLYQMDEYIKRQNEGIDFKDKG